MRGLVFPKYRSRFSSAVSAGLTGGSYSYSGVALPLTAVVHPLSDATELNLYGITDQKHSFSSKTVAHTLSLGSGIYFYTGAEEPGLEFTLSTRLELISGSYDYQGVDVTLTRIRKTDMNAGAYAYAGAVVLLKGVFGQESPAILVAKRRRRWRSSEHHARRGRN